MKAVLKEKVSIKAISLFSEIGVLKYHPEWRILCSAAITNGGRIAVGTLQGMLPGLSNKGSENILKMGRYWGIIDERNVLTELGKDVAQDGMIPLPEQGVYKIWYIDHQVLGFVGLDFDRIGFDRQVLGEPSILRRNIPTFVPWTSVFNPSLRFLVRSGAEEDRPVIEQNIDSAICEINWEVDFTKDDSRVELNGSIGGKKFSGIPIPIPQIDYAVMFLDLLEQYNARFLQIWDKEKKRLMLSKEDFDKLASECQESFLLSVKIHSAQVNGKGHFDTTIKDIPIAPVNQVVAQYWADKIFYQKIKNGKRYWTALLLEKEFETVVAKTSLGEFGVQLTPLKTWVNLFDQNNIRDLYWQLIAPSDLAVESETFGR